MPILFRARCRILDCFAISASYDALAMASMGRYAWVVGEMAWADFAILVSAPARIKTYAREPPAHRCST